MPIWGNGGTVTMAANTSLAFTASGTYTHAIKVTGDPNFIVGSGLSVTQSGEIDDGGGTPGVVEVSGGGTLQPDQCRQRLFRRHDA